MKFFFYVAKSFNKSFLALIFVALSATVFAQQASLTVQGVLTKADGTAVEDDVYTLTFRLWNHPDATGAGNKKHEETINNVETVGGVYTVILGINGTPLSAGFDEIYYLGVSMNTSNVELLPRPRLTHAPYALGIKGQNNTFPSTGPVIGDAFRAKGGPASGGPGGNGFAFQAPSGDENGGLFSDGADNISIYAGGGHKAKFSNGLNELFGQTNTNALSVFGALTSGDHTINGNSQVNGWQVVTGDERVEGNQFCNNKFLTAGTSGGYSFDYDGGYDTGMFGEGNDGEFFLKSNGQKRLTVSASGTVFIGPGAQGGAPELFVSNNDILLNTGSVRWFAAGGNPGGGSGTVRRNINSGLLWVDNSSRRYKTNIRPLREDFRKILMAQPKIYNRIANPGFDEIGYIAEEMDSIGMNHIVEYNDDGTVEGLNYERMIMYAVEVLKIQDVAITELQAEIAALKVENKGLQVENSTLSAENNKFQQQQEVFNAQLEALSKRMNLLENTRVANTRK